MPFQIRDETAGRDLFWIDNAGQLGLGSMPIQGQKITVLGSAVLDSNARFPDGSLRPGVPAAFYGSVYVPAGSTVNVSVSTMQPPTVSSILPPAAVSNSNISFPNTTPNDVVNTYSAW